MQKILLISNHGGGFYNFKKELVVELLNQGYAVHFAVPNNDVRLTELTMMGAVYHELQIDRRGMNPIQDLGLIRELNAIIKTVNPDLIISHTIKPNIYASIIAVVKKIPYMNNITGLGSALQHDSKMAKILRAMYKISLKNSSGIFFENKGNCEYFRKYNMGNSGKYIVVAGAGVNIDYFTPDSGFKLTEGSEEGRTVFLYIGRIMKDKGIEEYLEAAKTIKSKYPNSIFKIIGFYDDDTYKESLTQLERAGIIEYLGVSPDTRMEMAEVDCIVLPSYHEGMSNVLLEGAAFGLPLITTNVNGCKEAVEDGITGFLCHPHSPFSLCEAMGKFLKLKPEEKKEMGMRGRAKMIAEFNRAIVIEKYIAVIKNVLNQ